MSLQSLRDKNQYPIVFIGSGMSKRFIKSSPDWLSLLEEYWNKLNQEIDFYSYLNNLRKEVIDKHPDYNDEKVKFTINAQTASFIENKFNNLYDTDNSIIPDLTPKKVFQENLSPFKYSVSKRFSELEFIPEMEDEIVEFSKVLGKSKMIVTTNYDLMVEILLKQENKFPDVFVGNKGFFNETTGWNELFKIHGTAEDSNSIVITESDYDKFNHDALLLNAKLLTSLIDSPIIFLGYSLTDLNIRTLLNDYSENLPTNLSEIADRITIVEYVEHQSNIIENIEHDSSLGINYTKIETNNYLNLFKKLNKINQGVSPNYIRKYQHILKKIIISKGKSGQLDTFLTTTSNIDSLSEKDMNSNIAVAIGDQPSLPTMLSLIDYLQDYLNEEDNIQIQSSIKFLLSQNSNSYTPYARIIKNIISTRDNINLIQRDYDKLAKMLSKSYTLEKVREKISITKTDEKYNSYTLDKIWNEKSLNEKTKIKIISKNINQYSDTIKKFLLDVALPRFTKIYNSGKDTSGISTDYRKLFVLFDLQVNGNITPLTLENYTKVVPIDK